MTNQPKNHIIWHITDDDLTETERLAMIARNLFSGPFVQLLIDNQLTPTRVLALANLPLTALLEGAGFTSDDAQQIAEVAGLLFLTDDDQPAANNDIPIDLIDV